MTIQVGLAALVETWENEGGTSASSARAEERLDWAGFLARFYPHARKHDYVPLAAYVEYRKTRTPTMPVSSTNPPAERSRP